MKRILCAVLLMCACSRSSLKAIERMAVADASPPVDTNTRPPDTNSPDTRPPVDTSPPDTRLPDTRAIDTSPPDTRAIDTSPPDTRAIDTNLPDTSDTRPVTCPSPVASTGDGERKIKVGTDERVYWLHIPNTYDGTQPVPLIFDFHASGGNGFAQSLTSPYPAKTDQDDAVIAFPTGLTGPWGSGWNLGPCCVADVDDVAFTMAMIDQIQSTVCIDKKRIYAVGNITGGGMAYALACQKANVFAAVSASAWDLLKENVADCKPSRPITVVSFRGTADSLVPYPGAYSTIVRGMPITFLGAQETFKRWAALDVCTGSPSKEDSNGCSKYSSCQGGVEVVLCTKQGGGSEVGDPGIAWPLLKKYSLP
jgi:polyhydroxybutyrate depolymerase